FKSNSCIRCAASFSCASGQVSLSQGKLSRKWTRPPVHAGNEPVAEKVAEGGLCALFISGSDSLVSPPHPRPDSPPALPPGGWPCCAVATPGRDAPIHAPP